MHLPRCVVVRYCEAHHRAVGEFYGPLHKTFAERSASHYLSAVLILYGSAKYFGSRRRVFVHQYNHFSVEQPAVSPRAVFLAFRRASLCIDYQVVLCQKLVSHKHGSLEISSAVVLQVYYDVSHAMAFQRVDTLHELLVRSRAETSYAYVSRLGRYHV